MIILIFIVCILMLTVAALYNGYCHKIEKISSYEYAQLSCIINVIAGLVIGIDIIVGCVLSVKLSTSTVYEKGIAICTEENTRIEQQIDETVKTYMQYESKTIEDCKTESSIQLVSLFPELKTDTLVQAQIDTYVMNSQEIKNLRVNQAYISVYKWWLYFGSENDE